MLAIWLDETLRFWMDIELSEHRRINDYRKRQQQIRGILHRWAAFGDAQLKIDQDKRECWSATVTLLQRLKEEKLEAATEFD